jgi:hypothetical protein
LDPNDEDEWKGLLLGYCTERAKARALQYLEPVIPSIVNTVCFSTVSGDGKRSYGRWGTGRAPRSFLLLGDGRRILSTCLSAYLRTPGSDENTILDRLHNATLLLNQADQAGADPIALSLSFGAIEALVCVKDRNPVNQQIKEHVSTLLVQNVPRRKAAEKVLGKLYGLRCDVMHGTKVQASREASQAVRRIAAGAVRAAVCWLESQKRVGGRTAWNEFVIELNIASQKQNIVVGVPDLSELIPEKLPT